MSSWATIIIKTGPDFHQSSEYSRTATNGLDASAYRRAELDGDHALITLYREEYIEDVLDNLFGDFGNRFLCPGVLVIEAENTGDHRTARLIRPPEKGEETFGEAEWSVVERREWIDRPDEGNAEVNDETVIDELEETHDFTAKVTHYRHHV